MTRPVEGTPCIECHAKGHFCPAQITVGHEALCLDCADGQPCLVTEVKERTAKLERKIEQKKAKPVTINGEEIVIPAHAVMGPEMIEPHARMKEEINSMPGKSRLQVSYQIRKAIAEANPKIPHRELAAQLGVSDATVIKYRKEAGIFVPLTRVGLGNRVAQASINGSLNESGDGVDALKRVFKPETKPKVETTLDLSPNGHSSADQIVRVNIPLGGGVSVSGALTEKECIEIFTSLPADEKARLLNDALRTRCGL